MKKAMITMAITLLVLAGFSSTGFARVSVNIGIGLPPPIVFSAPPEVVVIPDTYVYVAPDVAEDIFFYDGYWWRPWEGHWYRSRNYREGWSYYRTPPSALMRIPSGWRADYRDHHWKGYDWNYSRIPHRELQKNWRTWEKYKHWEHPKYRQLREPQRRDVKSDVHQRQETQRGPQTRPSDSHKKGRGEKEQRERR